MKYLKPKCECGENLVYIEERTHEDRYAINRYGETINKRKRHRSDIGLTGASWLECLKCQKEYDIDYEEDGNKIIRGDERRY